MTTCTLYSGSVLRRAWRVFASACFATASAIVACAQTVPAASANRIKPAAGDEIISLSEFTVSADAQTGYVASQTMTGSRIPTRVQDLPFNIDVITSDFMDDFATQDYSKIVLGGMLTSDQDGGSGYTIRGISSGGQLYNGFWQPAGTPVPSALRDRTEILKGPSAGVYGQTSPGGMINIVPRQPRTTPSQSVRVQAGNFNLLDVRAESTGPLSAKTSYLAIANTAQRSFGQPWHEDRGRTIAFSLAHRFSESSNLKFDLVAANQRNHSPANRVPYYFNSSTSKYYGIAYELFDKSGTGPTSYKNNDNYSLYGIYEKRLNQTFSLRAGGEVYSVNSRSFNTTDVTSYDPDPTHVRTNLFSTPFFGLTRLRSASSSFSAPSYQHDNRAGGGAQTDLLARSRMFNSKLENRALLTFDFTTFYEYIDKIGMNQTVSTNSTTGLPTLNATTGAPSVNNADDTAIFPIAPRFAGDTNYWLPVFDPLGPRFITGANGLVTDAYNLPNPGSGLYAMKSWQKARRDVFGVMLRDQATLWNRLLVFGTVRFDNVMYNIFTKQYPNFSLKTYPTLANYVATAFPGDGGAHPGYQGSVAHYHSDAITGSGGMNYRVWPGLAAYANYSTSFVPSTQVVTGATTGSYVLPNETAEGWDYGFKGSFMQDRLTFTVGGFYVNQQHISVTANDANGIAIKQAVGDAVSKGGELSANYFITKDWAINAGYFYTSARWVNTGNDLDMAGRRRAGVPDDLVTFATKYTFPWLRGLSTNWMYQYIGKSNAEERGNTTASGSNFTPVGSNNGLRNIIRPGVALINAGLSYDFKSRTFGESLKHRLQFNVNNLTDRSYVTLSRGVGDGRTYYFTYQVSH